MGLFLLYIIKHIIYDYKANNNLNIKMLYKNHDVQVVGVDITYSIQIQIKHTKEALKNIRETCTHNIVCLHVQFTKSQQTWVHCIIHYTWKGTFTIISDTLGLRVILKPCQQDENLIKSERTA